MPRIHHLPSALVDQIAAGEVVERPASVVKELLENAVDAEAQRVRIEVRGGGNDLVAIADDGFGMSEEDARLALERHATSKLRRFEELRDIASYGFRGEALPAIASVSRFSLRTRARGAAQGVLLRVENGALRDASAAGGPEGTRIEVADLFGALPARRKFLKREATEWGHIADTLTRAALALPQLHFDVQREGRAALSWPAASVALDRVAAVLGEKTASALLEAQRHAGERVLHAFVSRPDAHRATAAGIYLFVNGRAVRDKTMRHALLQVARDVLPRGRFPTALLFLEDAPGAVDVNVHPAKWEVRFDDPRAVHQLVANTVREAISARGWPGAEQNTASVVHDADYGRASQARGARESQAPGAHAQPPHAQQTSDAHAQQAPGTRAQSPHASQAPGAHAQQTSGAHAPQTSGARGASAAEGERAPGVSDWVFARTDEGEAREPAPHTGRLLATPRFAKLRCLGQLRSTYLLTESENGLLLVDQHAAHERVLYEGLRARWLDGALPRQPLLAPLTLELDAAAHAALCDAPELAERLGFEFEPYDGGALALRAVPQLLATRDPAGLLASLAEELRESGGASEALRAGSRILDAADRIFASMACHAARRAGEKLGEAEQRALLKSLDEIPWAPTCPHGRPVAVEFAREEIERRFGRR